MLLTAAPCTARAPLSPQGYDFYLQFLYLSMTILLFILALCGYASYTLTNPRAYIWPLWVLRAMVRRGTPVLMAAALLAASRSERRLE